MYQKLVDSLFRPIVKDEKTYRGTTKRTLRFFRVMSLISLLCFLTALFIFFGGFQRTKSLVLATIQLLAISFLILLYILRAYDGVMKVLLGFLENHKKKEGITALLKERINAMMMLFEVLGEVIDEHKDANERLERLCSNSEVARAATLINRERLDFLHGERIKFLLEISENLDNTLELYKKLGFKRTENPEEASPDETAQILAKLFEEQEGLQEVFLNLSNKKKGGDTLN